MSESHLTEAERRLLLTEWNDTQRDYPRDFCVHQLFEQQAARTPTAIALVFGPQEITYGELNRRANLLAHFLREKGVEPGRLVGLCLERSPNLVVGLLGILKAGAAYVPLDPAYPRERLAYMLEDAGTRVLVTDSAWAATHLSLILEHDREHPTVVCLDADGDEIARQHPDNPVCEVKPEQLAYTIYTSGSTGRPKGVEITHRSLVNFLTSMGRRPGVTARDTLLAVTSISFDIAGLELFLPLLVGARIVLADRETTASGSGLARLIRDTNPTAMQATPATWYLLLADGWGGHPGLKILCGGEALPRSLAERLLEKGAHLWNLYGPTETTIWSTVYEVGKGGVFVEDGPDPVPVSGGEPRSVGIPIGTPIANTRLYILDEEMQPVPIGAVGELHIGGDGLARGYRNRPDLTAERFVPDPFGGGLLYKTGDLARYLPDGQLAFLGRLDHQVKIRGFRIELGEIEAVLDRHPGVHRSVVTVHEDQDSVESDGPLGAENKQLVAYVVPERQYRSETEAGEETGFEARQVSQWAQVWDLAYSCEAPRADPTFNTSGWNDSYTGAPVPAEHIREWVETTVARLLALKPDRVLEIGCGTGLLLFRVAPHCSYYCASDVAPSALDYIRTHQDLLAGDGAAIHLRQGAADDFDGLESGAFDTVIINSVVQLFPSIHYLVHVLEQAVKLVRPGGAIFVGDVRNHALLEAFHTSVQWQRVPGTLSRAEFRRRVQKGMAREGQLVIDPAFFMALQRQLPAISQVEIQLRRGNCSNEMNQFRYDAILHIGKETSTPHHLDLPVTKSPVGNGLRAVPKPPCHSEEFAPDPRNATEGVPYRKNKGTSPPRTVSLWRDWRDEGITWAWVQRQLTEVQPETLGIARIPNARLAAEMRLLAWLEGEGDAGTVGELRQALGSVDESAAGVEPETWWRLADETGYTAYVEWSSGPDAKGCYDVWLQQGPALPARFAAAGDDARTSGPIAWTHYANNPLQRQVAGQLEPALRDYLREQLPDYMVPALFVTLDEMPLTPSGKVDRKALPAPERTRPRLATGWVEPESELERQLASIWQQVLGLDAVGTLDNFFELGGNSLLLTLVHHRLEGSLGREVPMTALFQYPTIRTLARYLEGDDDTTGAERAKGVDRERLTYSAGTDTGDGSRDIAIIGLSCRFPGAPTPEQFWENLRDGVESITFFSDEELEVSDPVLLADPSYVKAGAVLPDIAGFDASFFGYSAREAEIMDPQHRLFLECAWEALERAGYNPETYPGAVGVYAGCGMNTYLLNHIHPNEGFSARTFLGSARELQIRLANSPDFLTTRVSYKLDLTGPSVTMQTACSTSLVAVHTACRALRNGECDLALAGGISITIPQKVGYPYQEDMICSPDGHCRAFDARAQGTVFGSGVGIVVLKPLDRALAAGDEIQAVIKGSAVDNDGAAKVGYTAPGIEGQVQVISAALADARIDPRTVSYLEAHGTGTALGDPVEVAALTQAYRRATPDTGFCALGSVKTNVGHLIEAAGVCGLIKTVLSLEHKQFPPACISSGPIRRSISTLPLFMSMRRLRPGKPPTSPAAPG